MSAPAPLAVLRGCGWLSAAAVADPALRVDATVSSHRVFRVTAPDGRCVVVKQVLPEAAERGRTLRPELFMYRLAAWLPDIAAILPRPVLIDESRQVLVVQSLACGDVWPDPAQALRLTDAPGMAHDLGGRVARLHRATCDMGLAPSAAVGILGLGVDLACACEGRRPEVRTLLTSITEHAELRGALDQGLGAYRHAAIIHGDLRPANWLPAATPRQGMCLLDWDMAGSGDPVWDLASLLAQACAETAQAQSPQPDAAHPWPAQAQAACQAVLRGYFEVPGPVAIDDDQTWRKLVWFTVARLLHLATEHAEQGAGLDAAPVRALVDAALAWSRADAVAAATLHRQANDRLDVS